MPRRTRWPRSASARPSATKGWTSPCVPTTRSATFSGGTGPRGAAVSHAARAGPRPRPTRFPTIQIPDAGDLSGYVQMAAGWNILVETGIKLGIDLDKPERARKVGNEFVG